MHISIFGLGYVGAVSLACLARDGHRVTGVDVDQAKLDLISAGKTPVVEEGMVVGLISIGDIVKWRVREYEIEQEALRDYIKTA